MKPPRPLVWLKTNHQILWLLVAIIITALTFISPSAELPRKVIDLVLIIDITQSMNAKDFQHNGQSISRLEGVKLAIQSTLKKLPCGSNVGIGIFASKDALLLFNPIEVCEHYSLLNQVVSRISWRMAWAGDSNIQRGLYSALGQVSQLNEKPNIIFLTDGEQTINEQYAAPLQKRSGKVKGLIIGVGGKQPVRIPKYSNDNQLSGYWKNKDLAHTKSAQSTSEKDEDYLSQLDEKRLREYALIAKLNFLQLQQNQPLTDILLSDEYTKTKIQTSDIRWILAILALTFLLTPYLFRYLAARHK